MEHQSFVKVTPAAPKLPVEEGFVKVTPTAPMLPVEEDITDTKLPAKLNCGGRILIREDTILTSFNGCAGCGRGQFTCTDVKESWSVLCWGRQSGKKYYCCKYIVLYYAVS